MSEQPLNPLLPNLTIKDKINFPFILGNAILKFHEAIIKAEGFQSEQETREAALVLFNSIPDSWRLSDEQFDKDLKKAVIKTKEDARPIYCGKRVGKPRYKTVEVIDPYKVYHACLNVMDRRGLLSKSAKEEIIDDKWMMDNGGEEIEIAEESDSKE